MSKAPCRDPQLWLALAAGPLVWGGMALLPGIGAPDWGWPLALPVYFAQLALLYPLLEELVFRGLLQGWLLRRAALRRRRLGVSGANGLTSLAFAAAHLFAHPPLAAASVFLPSLVFGHFRERSGGLRLPMLLHAWYNAGLFWLFLHPR